MKKRLLSIFYSHALRNSLWSTCEVLALPVLMLLVTPFFIHRLGPETYGQWILINSIIASLGILNFGLGDATIRYLAKYRIDDPARTVRIANTTYSFYLLISALGILIAFIYLSLEKNVPLFFSNDKNPFIDLLSLGVVLFGIRLIEQVIFSIYKGFERFDLFSRISVTSKIALILSNVIVVYLGYSLDVILFYSIIASFVFLIIEFVLLKAFLPGFTVLPNFTKEIFFEIMKYGLWSWVQSIVGILSYQLDKFLVAYFAGVAVLAYYSVAFTIATQLFNLFVAASNWVFPKVSRNNMSQESMITLYHTLQFGLVSVASITISVFFLVKNPFLRIWLGPDISAKALPYIDAYLIYILFTAITIIPSYFLMGTGNIKLLIANSSISILFTCLSMYIMFESFGPIGLVYGRIISGFVTLPLFLFLFYRFVLGNSYKYIILEALIPLFFSLLLVLQDNRLTIVALIGMAALLYKFVVKRVLRYKEV